MHLPSPVYAPSTLHGVVQALYPWLVFVHILAAFGFVLAHGVAAFAAFRIRSEREPQRIAAMLDLSSATLGASYTSLMLLIVAGIAAGIVGSWFGQRWPWVAIGALVAILAAMLGYAAPYYARLREALGLPVYGRPPTRPPASAAELAALLDSRRPEVIAATGGLGLALVLWLMYFKPF
jgi:hypothetical protein